MCLNAIICYNLSRLYRRALITKSVFYIIKMAGRIKVTINIESNEKKKQIFSLIIWECTNSYKKGKCPPENPGTLPSQNLFPFINGQTKALCI
ncbi:MAG: hypothetical protein PWQ17_1932 [Anaerophaga sp.]|nr:hypothetical protein [Anaerophaga sp.]MDK2842426.1 hypothetical protein [Anaerophaga sp.]MDN5292166.1 hypothetical protein [Anaerophaga sp.]